MTTSLLLTPLRVQKQFTPPIPPQFHRHLIDMFQYVDVSGIGYASGDPITAGTLTVRCGHSQVGSCLLSVVPEPIPGWSGSYCNRILRVSWRSPSGMGVNR